jgi:hypothetical protein
LNGQSPSNARRTGLDAYDTRILAELQADARLTMAELGRRVHLSQPAVTERVRKLEAAGVITGYRATVNLGALGYGIRALVRVGRCDFGRMLRLDRGHRRDRQCLEHHRRGQLGVRDRRRRRGPPRPWSAAMCLSETSTSHHPEDACANTA